MTPETTVHAREVLAEEALETGGFVPVHLDTLGSPRTSRWRHADGRVATARGAADGTATVTVRGPRREDAEIEVMAIAGAAAFDLTALRERDPACARDLLAHALVEVHAAMTAADPRRVPEKETTSRWVDDVGLEALAWLPGEDAVRIVPKVMDEVGGVYAVSEDIEETFPGWAVFEMPSDPAVLADALAGRLEREEAIVRGLVTRFLPSQVDAR